MITPNDGGPAFPHKPKKWNPDFGWDDTIDGSDGMGMTLRDWFAGQALTNAYMGDYSPIEQGRVAYEIADAMLAAREKGTL